MDGKRGVDMQVRKGSASQNAQQIFSAGGALDGCTPSNLEPKLCARNPVFPNKNLNETGKFPALGCGGPWVLYTQNIKEFVQNLDAARIRQASYPEYAGAAQETYPEYAGCAFFVSSKTVFWNRVPCPQKPCVS